MPTRGPRQSQLLTKLVIKAKNLRADGGGIPGRDGGIIPDKYGGESPKRRIERKRTRGKGF